MNVIKPSCLILVDFDNFFKKPIAEYSPEEIEYQLKQVITSVLKSTDIVEYIEIRLYGGWLAKGILSMRASQVSQLVGQIDLFPILRSGKPKVTGDVVLAKSLRSHPEIQFNDTYREKDGVARMRICHDKMGHVCKSNRKTCPPYILYSFTRDKGRKCSVDTCSNLNMDVFKALEQKMVDGMIATDLIDLAQDSRNWPLIKLILLSDDYDHVPSLIYAAKVSKASITVGLRNENTLGELQRIFDGLQVEVTTYE